VDKPKIDVLAERIGRLEQENRRWRWGGGFALIAGFLVMLSGAQRADAPKIVEAEQFIVRDSDGKERVRLGLASGGAPALFLRNKDGSNRVILQASDRDDSGSLYLFGEGKGLEGLSVALNGGRRASNSPSLVLRHDDKRRINLNVDTTPGRPWLRFEDENGILHQVPESTARKLAAGTR
jgi:xanthine/CO dehydrogenase XdhC/CoxF family maturation factor